MTSLKYHRGMAHWMEFVSLAQKRSYGGSLRLVVLAMGAAPMLLAIVLDARWPGSLDPMSVLFGMLGTLLLVSVLSKVGARRHVRETGWILGDREITLREDGLTDAGKGAVLNVTWPAIEDVSVAKGCRRALDGLRRRNFHPAPCVCVRRAGEEFRGVRADARREVAA